ncbi:DUF6338 family protein [Streptomyces sp. SID3343]|uniref:DUF6338 family protein n=1 Tax=Streptomyces sp. SID3343 TaxID=2690260 RepID=UPI00136CBAF0|nr:DUF6338 family protein [Streptomyces sp. SID3343]MYW02406.1 hypothetical protein [Streptomyces sp. SID3343]
MGQSPTTVSQVALLICCVLPGVTHQFVRERLRGPIPGERDLAERVLRALVASLVLDAMYLLVAGPLIVRVVRGPGADRWDGLVRQPRAVALAGLILFVLVPVAAAVALTWWERRHRDAARYHDTPTAWDRMFRNQGSCFVRMRMRDGAWVGGWYGSRSYATAYPQPQEVFLESAWLMNADGSFVRRIAGSIGLHVRAGEVDVVELLSPGTRTQVAPS